MAELAEGKKQATVERVTVTSGDGTSVPAIHAIPDEGASTAVVVHPDIMGIRPLFDDLCRRIATHGYSVACPEPFVRAPDEVRRADDPMVRMAHVKHLDDDLQIADLVACADRLTEDGATRVHVMGFCMGGMQTLKAAANGRFARAVAFYGMIRLPADWRGAAMHEPLDTVGDVCPTLAIFGDADSFTPEADIDALRDAWRDRDDCEIVVYAGAEHGFVHAPERPAHRADDAGDAWHRTLAWFAR